MQPLVQPPASARALALTDGAAIAVFAVIGIVSHTGSVSVAALAEDAVPLLIGWFAAATAFRPYARRTLRALLWTWALGISLGVFLRAAVLGRLDEPRQLAFLATTLVLTLGFVMLARLAASLLLRT